MAFPTAIEKLADAYVRNVRDQALKRYVDIVRGVSGFAHGKELHRKLAASGLSPEQRAACEELVWSLVDELLSEVLAFVEYAVTIGCLDITAVDSETGERYRIKGTDMIAAEFCSGDDTWVDKYSRFKEPGADSKQ